MDEKKLFEIINEVDDKYLLKSEKINKDNRGRIRVAQIACGMVVAAAAVLMVFIINAKLNNPSLPEKIVGELNTDEDVEQITEENIEDKYILEGRVIKINSEGTVLCGPYFENSGDIIIDVEGSGPGYLYGEVKGLEGLATGDAVQLIPGEGDIVIEESYPSRILNVAEIIKIESGDVKDVQDTVDELIAMGHLPQPTCDESGLTPTGGDCDESSLTPTGGDCDESSLTPTGGEHEAYLYEIRYCEDIGSGKVYWAEHLGFKEVVSFYVSNELIINGVNIDMDSQYAYVIWKMRELSPEESLHFSIDAYHRLFSYFVDYDALIDVAEPNSAEIEGNAYEFLRKGISYTEESLTEAKLVYDKILQKYFAGNVEAFDAAMRKQCGNDILFSMVLLPVIYNKVSNVITVDDIPQIY